MKSDHAASRGARSDQSAKSNATEEQKNVASPQDILVESVFIGGQIAPDADQANEYLQAKEQPMKEFRLFFNP